MDFSAPMGGLFTEPRAAVLAVLVRSGVPLTGRQIHARITPRWSLRAVQNALAGLERLGMTEQEAVGRAVTHVLNRDHYAVPYIDGLLSPTAALRQVIEEFYANLGTSDRQPRGIWLFGSIARGEPSGASDIDLALVVSAGEWDDIAGDLSHLVRRRLGNACDVVIVDAQRLASPIDPDDTLIASLLEDAIALAGEDVSTLERAGA